MLGQRPATPLDLPLGVILRVEVGFRVGHQPEHSPRGVAQPRDRVQRPVRVVGELLGGRSRFRIRVAAGDAPGRFQPFEELGVECEDLAFAVAHRQRQRRQTRVRKRLSIPSNTLSSAVI